MNYEVLKYCDSHSHNESYWYCTFLYNNAKYEIDINHNNANTVIFIREYNGRKHAKLYETDKYLTIIDAIKVIDLQAFI